jgi:hypothetical protein
MTPEADPVNAHAKGSVQQPPRQPVERLDVARVEGSVPQPARNHVRAAPHGHESPLRDRRDLDRDLACRRPRADHEHALTGERRRHPVVVGVAHLSVETARIRWEPRAPVHAGRDNNRSIAAPQAAIEADRPPTAGSGFNALHGRAERDQRAQPEPLRVSIEVGGHLAVMRKVTVRLRHREARVLHTQLRRVRVQRGIGARQPVVVPVAPEPADIGAALEASTATSASRSAFTTASPDEPAPITATSAAPFPANLVVASIPMGMVDHTVGYGQWQ